MAEDMLTYELDGDVAIIGLNRPEKRNAINQEFNLLIRDAVFRAGEEARCGVIFGHGTNFSAGLDLAEAAQRFQDPNNRFGERNRRHRWYRTFDLISRGPIPWVAALHGATIGGGLELAAAVHIRVADETTFFALPEGQRGIFVGGGGTVRIQRLMGYARMADLMLTGRVLSAAEGERANLAQYVVPKGEHIARAKEIAAKIASNTIQTNWAICNCLPRVNDLSHEDGLFMESLISASVRSPESQERLKAFVEHRTTPIGPAGDD